MRDQRRFVALDGWRGVCASLVALFHMPTGSHLGQLLPVQNAWLFVDFFFVLSGFVISHAAEGRLWRPGENSRFLLKRFARLWPLHAVMLGAMVLLEAARGWILGGGLSAGAHPRRDTRQPRPAARAGLLPLYDVELAKLP